MTVSYIFKFQRKHSQQGYVFEIMTGVKLETEEKKMADTSFWSTNCSKPWVSESHH